MKHLDLENVEEATDYERLSPGGYVVRIMSVEDITDREYLKMEFDILDGDFAGYYQKIFDSRGYWLGKMNKSYKEKALPFFKAMITAVTNSNQGFAWRDQEQDLVQKIVGVVLSEEEYTGNDGKVKTRTYVSDVRSIQSIRQGDFIVKPLKELKDKNDSAAYTTPDNELDRIFG